MERLLLKMEEAADALSVGRSKMYAMVQAGVVPSVRLGGEVRVPADALRAWVAARTAESLQKEGAA